MVADNNDYEQLFDEFRSVLTEVNQGSAMTKDSAKSIGNLPITAKEAVIVVSAIVSLVAGGAFGWAKLSSYIEVTSNQQKKIIENINEIEQDFEYAQGEIRQIKNQVTHIEWRLELLESKEEESK